MPEGLSPGLTVAGQHPSYPDTDVPPAVFDSTFWDVLPPVAQAMPVIRNMRRTTAPPIRVRQVRPAL